MKKNQITSEVSIKANIQALTMAKWVTKGSKWVDLARLYARTGNRAILALLKLSGAVLEVSAKHNLIVTRGRAVLAELLAGGTTYTGEINYGALGTGVSPVPANASTQLDTEIYRNQPASQTFDNNIAYIDFFYDATEVPGVPLTITEFGNFIDGAAGANTGRLWSYIATGGWSKTSTTSLFVSCKYTIS